MSNSQVVALPEAEAEQQKAARKALLEAIIYVTEEPVTLDQLAKGLEWPKDEVEALIGELMAEHQAPARGVEIRAVAGGYKLSTKAEHHEAVRHFVKTLKPPLKLSMAALETLSVIAYKQPITMPEIQEIRGLTAASGVVKTLLDRKLITTSGRKAVIGRPILYKTTREFLVQFGLNDVSELPSLKEFEELSRAALGEAEAVPE